METSPKAWFWLGSFFGASLAGVIACALMTLGLHSSIRAWLQEFQTLLTGFMALGGAIITVVWIQRQIDQAHTQEADRRERQHFAARATMPAALAELVDYAEDALEALRKIPEPTAAIAILHPPTGWVPPPLPRVPNDAVAVLRTCIETADLGPRQEIASLLAHLQICNSRLYGLFNDEFVANSRLVITQRDMHTHFADFVELHLRSDRMIKYARGEEKEIENPTCLSSIMTRAIFANLENYPGFKEALAQRYREGT